MAKFSAVSVASTIRRTVFVIDIFFQNSPSPQTMRVWLAVYDQMALEILAVFTASTVTI
jgi:hypothetical protein